jgi:hypothetical protein
MLVRWFDPFYFWVLKLMFFHRAGGSSNDEVSNSHKKGEHIVTLQTSQNSLLCVVYVIL